MKILTKIAIVMLAALAVAACEEKGPMEELGENIDEASEELSQAADDACEDIKEGAGAEDTNC